MKFLSAARIVLYSSITGVISFSCLKDNKAPDCTKPQKPVVTANISVNEGDDIKLTASGVDNATYYWSGPKGYYSDQASPVIKFANLSNIGTYYVKALVGQCYSDSVPTYVFVKTDSTCNLGNNYADFPNGTRGPFYLYYDSAVSSPLGYVVTASDIDTNYMIKFIMKTKPTKSGIYTMVNGSPGNNEMNFGIQVKISPGEFSSPYSSPGNSALVKYDKGKANLVICSTNFNNLGVFSANIVCK